MWRVAHWCALRTMLSNICCDAFMRPLRILIDQGNSFCKIAFSHEEELISSITVTLDKAVESIARFPRVDESSEIVSIYCCVGECYEPLRAWLLKNAARMIMLDEKTSIPMAVEQYDRTSLGVDRIAAAVGALSLYPTANDFLVIDIGTAITFDRINRKRGFLGGNISAGPGLRAEALRSHTAHLPYVEPGKHKVDIDFALDTKSAIANGVFLSVLYEIEGYIALVKKNCPDALVLLTGGYASYFVEKIKNVTFVERLTMVGLNSIVSYNENIEIN